MATGFLIWSSFRRAPFTTGRALDAGVLVVGLRWKIRHDFRAVSIPAVYCFGDVDGDGCADLVYVEDRKLTLWLNQQGERWSDPIQISGTPAVSGLDSVRLIDLLGNGVSGVLWITAPVVGHRDLFFGSYRRQQALSAQPKWTTT